MKIHKILAVCLSMLLFAASGCGAPGKEKTTSSGNASTVSSTSTASQGDFLSSPSETVSSAESVGSMSSSNKPIHSGQSSSENASSSPSVSSDKDQSDSEWVAYDTNKDHYKLHIKRKDGTQDHVILNDVVLAPCVSGGWVYFFSNLSTIEKVRLNGSQRVKVCNTPDIMEINGSTAVTAEYKEGYIFYKTQQMQEVGDNSSYPVHYYKLDPDTNKITEVKS